MSSSDPPRLADGRGAARSVERRAAVLLEKARPVEDVDDAALARIRRGLHAAPRVRWGRWRWAGVAGALFAATAFALTVQRARTSRLREPAQADGISARESARPRPVVSRPAGNSPPSGEGCGVHRAGSDLVACADLTVGSAGSDRMAQVIVAPDATVAAAGVLPSLQDPKLPAAKLLEGADTGDTSGTIVRTDAHGRILSLSRLGRDIRDLDVHRPGGDLVVVGSFGLARLDAQAGVVRWRHKLPGGALRVAAGTDGVTAVLDGESAVHVFDAEGQRIGGWRQPDQFTNDLAVDARQGLVVVTGYNPKLVHAACGDVAFVRAYDRSGAVRWSAYDWSTDEIRAALDSGCPRTRGIRVVTGRDQKLYFLGENVGARTIFTRDARDLAVAAPNVAGDQYARVDDAHHTPAAYVARLSPATGAVEAGTFLLARAPDRKPNSTRGFALDADERGHVVVGGEAGCCIAGRDRLTINGEPVGTYGPSDGWFAILGPDFATRLNWVAWPTASRGPAKAVAIGAGRLAIAADQTSTDVGVRRLNTLRTPPPGPGVRLLVAPAPSSM